MPFNGLATPSLAKLILNQNLTRSVVKKPTLLLHQNSLEKNCKNQPTSVVSKSKKNRIYVGALDPNLKSEHVKAVFEAFGKIESCKLIPNSDGPGHKGYGFIEYEKETSAAEAVKSMNEFELISHLRLGHKQIPQYMELTPALQIAPLQ